MNKPFLEQPLLFHGPWPFYGGAVLLALAGVAGLVRWVRLKRRRAASAGHRVQGEEKSSSGVPGRASPLELLVEQVREYAICQLDGKGCFSHWNRGAEQLLGWKKDEILGQPFTLLYPEEEMRALVPDSDLERARAEGSFSGSGWRVRKDGSRFPASLVLTCLQGGPRTCDRIGGPEGSAGYLAVIRDGSERLESEHRLEAMARNLEAQVAERTAALQESQARLLGIFRHAPAAIAIKGLDGRLLLVNRRAEALIGLSLAATPDASRERLFQAGEIAWMRAQEAKVLERREEFQGEESMAFPDGTTRDYLVQQFPMVDGQGRCWGLGVIATNITERKRFEQSHLHHQKIESLQLLAGGIAHDFNNILGAMLGNVEMARLDGGSPEHLQGLEELIDRASSLVNQILAYAGKGKAEFRSLDLNREVEEMARLLRSSFSGRADLRVDPGPGLPPMEGDEGQVRQVILNLMLNAAEAVDPGAGVITVRTRAERLEAPETDPRLQGQGLNPGPYLVLEVADDGSGMSPELRERIFDPFFTTKFAGRGLGLAAVQGILRGHGGGVLVTSEEGRGTTFKVYFPAREAPGTLPAPAPREEAGSYQGSGTILVVDDEDELRSVAVAVLRRHGFECLEARDGVEALALFEEHWERIRLIVMDLTMPRMGGEEAYRHLRRAGALAPILLCSGFGPEEALKRFQGMALAGFLRKPYSLQALIQAVQDALEGMGTTADLRGNPPRELVAWITEYDTGHALLDTQHKSLVRAFNHLVATTEDGIQEAQKAFLLFIEIMEAHWSQEEGLMARAAFPGTREHRALHEGMLRTARDLADRIQRGEASFSPAVLNRLEDEMLDHIQLEDRDLARHLLARGA